MSERIDPDAVFDADAGDDPENPTVPETPAHEDLDPESIVDELDIDPEAVVDELDPEEVVVLDDGTEDEVGV